MTVGGIGVVVHLKKEATFLTLWSWWNKEMRKHSSEKDSYRGLVGVYSVIHQLTVFGGSRVPQIPRLT